MALKAVITEEEFGELEEATQSFYAWDEQTERYHLEVEDVDSHPDVAKLRRSHQRSKQEREEAKQKAKDLERRLGKIAEVDPEINLEDADDETVQRALKILKGEEEEEEHQEGGQRDKDRGRGPKAKVPDIEKVKADARKPLEKELEGIKAERDQYANELDKLVRDQALTEALSSVQVAGPYLGPLKSYFDRQIEIEVDDEGGRQALIDTEYGKQPLTSYIKEWAASDEGKAFIQGHTGGGATGSKTNGQKKRNPWLKGQEDFNEQMRMAREEPDLARQMAQQAGKRIPV